MTDREKSDAIYLLRWPRAAPAFDHELDCCNAVRAALAHQAAKPGPRADRAVERAEKALREAQAAYGAAVRLDRKEQAAQSARRECAENREKVR